MSIETDYDQFPCLLTVERMMIFLVIKMDSNVIKYVSHKMMIQKIHTNFTISLSYHHIKNKYISIISVQCHTYKVKEDQRNNRDYCLYYYNRDFIFLSQTRGKHSFLI